MPTKPSSDPVPEWRQELKEDVGEDPGRFLDRDLTRRHRTWVAAGDDSARMETRPDTACPTEAEMVKARIRGIDRLDRIAAWEATERRLAAEQGREPRTAVLDLLAERKEYLEEQGTRAERIADAPRRDPEPTETTVVWTDREGGTRSSTHRRSRVFDRGGEESGEGSA